MARKMNSLTVVGGGGSGPQSGITRENYVEKAREFVRDRNNQGFVIRAREGLCGSIMTEQPATEPQWIAWMGYLDGKGVPTKFAKSRGMTTVPCEWPEDFDTESPVSDRHAQIFVSPARRSVGSMVHRAHMAMLFRDLSASLSSIDASKPSRRPLTAEELAEAYRQRDAKNGGPPKLSVEAMASFREGH